MKVGTLKQPNSDILTADAELLVLGAVYYYWYQDILRSCLLRPWFNEARQWEPRFINGSDGYSVETFDECNDFEGQGPCSTIVLVHELFKDKAKALQIKIIEHDAKIARYREMARS